MENELTVMNPNNRKDTQHLEVGSQQSSTNIQTNLKMTHAEAESVIIPLAALTVVFYSLLALTAAWYYRKFSKICEKNKNGQTNRSNLGKFDEAKSWFFLWLMISAIADIPLYVGCIAEGGPKDCEWNGMSYPIFWFLHLCAVCGYAYTIIIPCLLWSDMLNKKDGILFLTKYPPDCTKRFFQISLLSYIALTLTNLIFGIIYYKVSDHGKYTSNIFYMICTLLEPIVIFAIAAGCFWCGTRLQLHVRRAKLGIITEIRFLLHMNITMAIIAFTYLGRAILILRLVTFLPHDYHEGLGTSYFVWLVCTRWLPYIFCSFCLVVMMRASGEEVSARRGAMQTKMPPDRGNRAKESATFKVLKSIVTVPGALGSTLLSSLVSNDEDHSAHSVSILSYVQEEEEDDDVVSLMENSLTSHQDAFNERSQSRAYSTESSTPSVDHMVASTPDMYIIQNQLHHSQQPPASHSSTFAAYSPPNWRSAYLLGSTPPARVISTSSPGVSLSSTPPP